MSEPLSISITLPYPPKELHPNSRCHWRARLGPKKSARSSAWALTLAAGGARAGIESGIIDAHWFHPQQRFSPHDDDNLTAWIKNSRDGIAAGLGIDDKRIKMGEHTQAKDPSRPRVEIVVTERLTEKLDRLKGKP